MNNTVSIVKCDKYEQVQRAVDEALELIGGIEKFVKKGDKVVIKPNLVSKKNPDEAVTTHPDFLHAVIVAVERAGGEVTIAESPGGPYNQAILKSLYSICGIDKAIEGTNAVLNYDTDFSEGMSLSSSVRLINYFAFTFNIFVKWCERCTFPFIHSINDWNNHLTQIPS